MGAHGSFRRKAIEDVDHPLGGLAGAVLQFQTRSVRAGAR